MLLSLLLYPVSILSYKAIYLSVESFLKEGAEMPSLNKESKSVHSPTANIRSGLPDKIFLKARKGQLPRPY